MILFAQAYITIYTIEQFALEKTLMDDNTGLMAASEKHVLFNGLIIEELCCEGGCWWP